MKLRALIIRKKMPKTAVVEIMTLKKHPYYHKRYKSHSRLAVDDRKNIAKVGDTVEIISCRPISKTKRWKIAAVI